MSIPELFEMDRIEVLCVLEKSLYDNSLSEIAGKNVLVDCALYMLAQSHKQKIHNLHRYVNVPELLEDINHVSAQSNIRDTRKEMLDRYARI